MGKSTTAWNDWCCVSCSVLLSSRGVPWHGIHSHIASLGAFVTIVALGTEPFTQQILSYGIREAPFTTAYTPRATVYNLGFRGAGGSKFVIALLMLSC